MNMVNGFIDRIAASGQGLMESNRDLSKYSGEGAVAMLKYDFANMAREMRHGRHLGASMGRLSESQIALDDSREFRDLTNKEFSNNMQAMVNHLAASNQNWIQYLDITLGMKAAMNQILEWLLHEGPKAGPRNPIEAYFEKPIQIPSTPKKLPAHNPNAREV